MPRLNPRSDSYEALLWDVVTNAHRYSPKEGDYVLDLGAHFGMFALFCAARECRVFAYEPARVAFSELKHTCEVAKEIGAGSITPYNEAVWSTPGPLVLNVCKETSGANSLVRAYLTSSMEPVEPVQAVTLKQAMSHCPEYDCVKMDIEGAEYEVLKSATNEDFDRMEFLTLELHNDILSREQCVEVDSILRNNFPHVEILPVKVQGKPTDQVCAYYCWR